MQKRYVTYTVRNFFKKEVSEELEVLMFIILFSIFIYTFPSSYSFISYMLATILMVLIHDK